MFNKKFIHEIFLKHTPLYSKKVLRAMFDRLAHASIMRLNAGSMDKVIRSYVIQTRRKQGSNFIGSLVDKVRKEPEIVKGSFTFECKKGPELWLRMAFVMVGQVAIMACFYSVKHHLFSTIAVWSHDHGGQTPDPDESQPSPPDHDHPQPPGRDDGLRHQPQHQEEHPHHLWAAHTGLRPIRSSFIAWV